VSSLRSVSRLRLPGRTAPSCRWLGVLQAASVAASRSVVAFTTALVAAASTVALAPLRGLSMTTPSGPTSLLRF